MKKYFYHKNTATIWDSETPDNELNYIISLWYKRDEIEITEEQYYKLRDEVWYELNS